MASTVPSGIFYPNPGEAAGNLQSDLRQIAETTQAALSKQANAYVGTSAERLAHTPYAGVGTLWSETDGDRKTYQFRNGRWFPDYEIVDLLPAFGGNPLFTIGYTSGLHVSNYGRMVTLTGLFNDPKRNQNVTVGSQVDLGMMPAQYAPQSSIYGLTWGRGKDRSAALLRWAVNRNTGADDGNRILIRTEEAFNVATPANSGSWVTFTTSWPIPESRWASL